MSNNITKIRVISSLIWKLLERGGTQVVQFIVTLVLARILLPEDFGLIVLVSVFISIANIFVQSGFNTALIQKKDADEIDFSSVFYLCLLIATGLYAVLFIFAPNISIFFEEPKLALILRVVSITLFFGSVNSIQIAVIAKKMQFKKLFLSSFSAVVISAVVGIVMAVLQFGVWALVAQQLINQLCVTLILWFKVKWRPKLVFSIKRLKSLFSFGWKLLISGIIETLYRNLRSILIGKNFSSEMLGFYDRGDQFPKLIVNNIDGSIQSVMLPTLSSFQDDKKRVKEIVRRSIVTSSFIVFPMMVGLAVIAESLISIVLTDKWLPSVPLLQILSFYYALLPIQTANLQAINAIGRSDIFLRLEVIKKTLGIGILLVSIPYGVTAIAFSAIVVGVISSIINAYPNAKLINYSYIEQWKDIFPSFSISLLMGAIVYSVYWLKLPDIWTIIIQITVGITIYIGIAKVLKLECYTYLVSTIKQIKNKKIS